jgi:hypothetical protein
VRVKKLNANEPLMICRKDTLLTKLSDLCTDRKTVTGNCLLVTGQPALRRQQLYIGFYMERGKLFVDAQKALLESRPKARDCEKDFGQFKQQLNSGAAGRSGKQCRTKS